MRRVLALLVALSVGTGCADLNTGAAGAGPSPGSSPSVGPSPTPSGEPLPSDRLRFVVLGDLGSGSTEQQQVADRMCRLRERRPFDLVVTTGDNVYDTGHPDRFEEVFFQPYECLLTSGVRFRSTLGNHDVVTDNGRPELREPAFGFKGRNYIVRRNGVRFVMVDSNSLNMEWLRRATRAEQGDRWIVVVFHHPVFSSGAHGPTPGLKPRLPRLFRKRGVDLVLNGHDHQYEATRSLAGIRYVVTGGGGASVRPCGEPRWFTRACISRFHFVEVVAGPERLKVRAMPRRGRPFHSFTTTGRG